MDASVPGSSLVTHAVKSSPETQNRQCMCVCFCMCMYVCMYLQRFTLRICMYVSTEVYFKKLAHVIVELDKSKICKVDLQTGGPGEDCCSNLKTI